MTNRAPFFDTIRPMFNGGHMTEAQVSGTGAVLDAWLAWLPDHQDLSPNIRWLAYALATVFHETDQTMQPIAEYGQGRGRDYGVPDLVTHQIYYGRGYIQLTWKCNYQVQGARLKVDLENNPELALRTDVAADVMLHGMAAGSFTGRRLGQYFGVVPGKDDPIGARRIINGQDCASSIAQYHRVFARALTASSGA